ncbi:DUF5808 domain-containing protein [Ethanoligenens sp.]|uniref:DUF5808 domain-containing protein n=1 Tax=Ethanoligenens sp. TaxID=2099655 RepID=UPI0039EC36F6
MSGSLWAMWLIYPPIAALCIAQPWFSRRNVLFSVVFGDTEVWHRQEMRAVRKQYLMRSVALCAVIGVAGLVWSLWVPLLTAVAINTGVLFAMIVGEGVLFVLARAEVRRFKASLQTGGTLVTDQITVETGMPERQTVLHAAWVLLLVPMLCAAVLLAVLGYPYLPTHIPIHYGWSGVPDAFSLKSWGVVLFPLFIHVAIAAMIAVSFLFVRHAPASVRGNPQAAPGSVFYRKVMAFLLLATGLLTQVIFLLIQIRQLVVFPMIWVGVSGILCGLSAIIMMIVYVRLVRVKKPHGDILDDDAKWVLGMFYYNPGDPSVFVEKRAGIGYTMNFARPLAWVFLVGIVVFVIGTLVFSFHIKK